MSGPVAAFLVSLGCWVVAFVVLPAWVVFSVMGLTALSLTGLVVWTVKD